MGWILVYPFEPENTMARENGIGRLFPQQGSGWFSLSLMYCHFPGHGIVIDLKKGKAQVIIDAPQGVLKMQRGYAELEALPPEDSGDGSHRGESRKIHMFPAGEKRIIWFDRDRRPQTRKGPLSLDSHHVPYEESP
jgi:hypothetical protein